MRKIVVKRETIEEIMESFGGDEAYEAFMKELMILGDTIHEFNREYLALSDVDVISLKAMRIVILSAIFFRQNIDTIMDLVKKINVVNQTEELKAQFLEAGVDLNENTDPEAPIEFC